MTVLYSKPNCAQCTATARKLKAEKVEHEVVDLSADPDALARIKGLGYLQAPVVVVDENTHWSGYRPDLILQHLA